jgi:hypothetical protein
MYSSIEPTDDIYPDILVLIMRILDKDTLETDITNMQPEKTINYLMSIKLLIDLNPTTNNDSNFSDKYRYCFLEGIEYKGNNIYKVKATKEFFELARKYWDCMLPYKY